MMGNKPYSTVSDVEIEGDKTTFTVRFGKVKSLSFGDSLASKPVQAGQDKWKVVYFPKGFTDADYASVYITNVACDMDEGDADNPDKLTTKSFGTVQLFMQPKPPNAPPEKKKKGDDDEEDGEDDDDDDDDVSSAASAATPKSTVKSGSKKSGSRKSGASSQRSASSRKSAEEGGAEGGGGGPILVDPIEKELSQMFTNKAPSWGFEKLFDMGLLYNWRKGYMLEYGENPEHLQSGYIEMKITIFAASGLKFDDPYLDDELTDSGRQRVTWTVQNIKRMIEKIGPKKRLSSAEFNADGEWYFDLYPNGFQIDNKEELAEWKPGERFISIYLHSSRRQVELGDVRKVWYRFGLKKQNPAELEQDTKGKKKSEDDEDEDDDKEAPPDFDQCYFPPESSCVSVFTPQRKCFGKHKAYDQKLLTVGRTYEGSQHPKEFVLGKYEQGGAVSFVLDMMVTDDEGATVQHMLHEIEEFGHKQDKCADTQEPLSGNKVICYHCGGAFSKEVTNYQARMEEYGYEIGREYITDILMREEEHWLDGFLKDINIPDKIDQALKSLTANMAKMRMVTDNMEEVVEEDDKEEEELDPEDIEDATLRKRVEKEKKLQNQFEAEIRRLRLDVEDSHFSKPICSKCAEKRKMLQGCKVVYANQPLKTREWKCPDQNALTKVLADGHEEFVPPKLLKQHLIKHPEDRRTNFRKGWRAVDKLVSEKYEAMDKAMSVINIVDPVVYHAADEWIIKKLPQKERQEFKANPALAESKPGRNAMTFVRGGRYVEPMELCVQCNGMVNADGVTPQEEEDAPRDVFCDVRFDVIPPPKRIYCLYTGKVYCDFCANPEFYKVPLPQYEDLYDKEGAPEPQPKQVCVDAFFKMGKTVQRIQPESKMPEEEAPSKRPALPEEEDEDDVDPFEFLLKIPCFGKPIYDKLEELTQGP
eukprot:Tamp_03605.p1 GENE.Tamp_03605~~Tamp_03605.p1  ORF type:complete len:928 (+),score=215.99 Tamp_03605:206-2989(+)